MPCFFAPACASLGFLHAAPLISLRYLQAGKQGRPILGNSWRKGACWHWAARYPTVPYGDGLLRFGLTALHTQGMLERTARLLADLWG